jgi:hypothetical protein
MTVPLHRRFVPVVLFFAAVLSLKLNIPAQEGELDKSPPKGFTPEQIIRRFTANEKDWKRVREQYTFRQEIKIEALDGDSVTGDYRQVADIGYAQGKRVKTAVFSPQPSITLSPEDTEDLETRSSFTISTDELPQYNVTYVGQQKLDELHCYVFDIAPKVMEKGRRYFEGRLWIDDQDLQIVKNRGKSVPEIKIIKKKKLEENLFPEFTTWREQIDGKYWFPTYSSADDVLHFNKSDVRMKQLLKFTDYKRAVNAVQK